MFSAVLDRPYVPAPVARPREPHVLLVVQDPAARYALADMLLDAGFRLTLASGYGVGSVLAEGFADIDLLIAAQPAFSLCDDSLTRRARAADPSVPILVLAEETASGPGVLGLVHQLIERWPLGDA